MKKNMYIGLFSFALLSFAGCGETTEETDSSSESAISADEPVSADEKQEMEKTIKLQEETEKLDKELDEFIKTL
jgi:uncharacterized protein YlxW (UPF0749 family)